MVKVRDLLNAKGREVLTVTPDTPSLEAIKRMTDRSVGSALVVERERLVGMFSERDYLRKVAVRRQHAPESPVREIMSTQLTTVTEETPVEECMSIMTEKRIRHLPVLQGERVVGVVSIGDVVKYLIGEKDFIIRHLQNYIAEG